MWTYILVGLEIDNDLSKVNTVVESEALLIVFGAASFRKLVYSDFTSERLAVFFKILRWREIRNPNSVSLTFSKLFRASMSAEMTM